MGYIIITDMLMENKVIREIIESTKKEKPALGTTPNWLVLLHRIKDLSGAIVRNAESDKMNTDLVREWALEIICHCNTIDELKSEKVKALRFSGIEDAENHKKNHKVTLNKQKEYSEEDNIVLLNILNCCVNHAKKKEPYIQRTGERYYGTIHLHGLGAPYTDGHGNTIVYK